ncbi:hypothetical protein ABT369_34635 [Dactylosporangium sp. NPDC000244]|uniref:hypothetical protein n=1 Tax=Dactylosporangium sp. NPDC000244 TaxID=3154365 RepID=UPI00331E7E81
MATTRTAAFGDGLAASKGEWSLKVRSGAPVAVDLARTEPGPVGPLTVAGYVLGLAAGALLALAVRRRGLIALAVGVVLGLRRGPKPARD